MNLIQQFQNQLEDAQLWEKEITLRRKDFLKVKGSTDTNLYFIVSGSVSIFFEDEFEEQIIRLGYKGNLIAALDSFISEQPSEIYIQAIKKCHLKVLSKKTFLNFIYANTNRMILWQKIIELLVYQQLEREKDLLTHSPLKRYQRVFERSPHLFQEIPNKYIASYLRMSPETLSRLKRRKF